MQNFASTISLFVDRPRLLQWTRMLSTFIGVQVAVQMLGMLSGLLLVTTLTKHEYALFTIANTMLGTMTVLSDTGISSGLSAVGGRVYSDRYRFGQLVNAALSLRKALGIVTLSIVAPLLAWLLYRNGAGAQALLTLTLLISFAFLIQLKL